MPLDERVQEIVHAFYGNAGTIVKFDFLHLTDGNKETISELTRWIIKNDPYGLFAILCRHIRDGDKMPPTIVGDEITIYQNAVLARSILGHRLDTLGYSEEDITRLRKVARDKDIAKAYRRGASTREIAIKNNISDGRVYQIIKKEGAQRHMLNEGEIVCRHLSGESVRTIANNMRVSAQRVSDVITSNGFLVSGRGKTADKEDALD